MNNIGKVIDSLSARYENFILMVILMLKGLIPQVRISATSIKNLRKMQHASKILTNLRV